MFNDERRRVLRNGLTHSEFINKLQVLWKEKKSNNSVILNVPTMEEFPPLPPTQKELLKAHPSKISVKATLTNTRTSPDSFCK